MLNTSTIRGTFRQIPYWKLRGRFHSCGYRDQEVAEYIGIGRDTMSGRMQGHNPWTSTEITAMCELLGIRLLPAGRAGQGRKPHRPAGFCRWRMAPGHWMDIGQLRPRN